MIDFDGIRAVVVKGLKEYVKCPVIRSNQNAEPPKYPFISYTVTTPLSDNKGTYGVYKDGKDRKAFTQTWSISALSDDNTESVTLALKAREWLDHVGTTYLDDNDVDVQSVGSVTNRDNVLTVEYEYKNGFDVVFSLFDVVDNPIAESGYIETAEINGEMVEERKTTEEMLEEELNVAVNAIKTQNNALSRLRDRLEGVNGNEQY